MPALAHRRGVAAVRIMMFAPLYAHSRAISGNMPSWQMISASSGRSARRTRGCRGHPAPMARPAPTDGTCGSRAGVALVVDDDAGVEGVAIRVALHDREAAPDALRRRRHEGLTSGPSSSHMISGLVSIDRPCSVYSGNTTRSIAGRAPLRPWSPGPAIRSVRRASSLLLVTIGQLQLAQPQHHTTRRSVQSSQTGHVDLLAERRL